MANTFLAGDSLIIVAGLLLFVGVIFVVFAFAGFTGISERSPAGADADAPDIAVEDNFLRRIARFVTPSDSNELTEARLRMARAGYRRPSAVRVFFLGRSVFGLLMALAASLVVPAVFTDVPPPVVLGILAAAVLVGFILPSLVLDRMIAARRQKAVEGFPDMLDMLLVCIEAGQGFEQATRRIARELVGHNDVLAEELDILMSELWAGRDRNAAFRDFAMRLNVDDISAFVTVVRHADQFGVSIADAIRVYASDMRFKRVMRAEGKANLMPLKIALASMLFTVIPTGAILIGPSILEIILSFSGTNGP